MPTPSVPRLELAHIRKSYPAVVANDDVSLTVQPGEIHAVLGENGAGKSTLMKIIYGAVQPDAGSMAFDGKPVTIKNPVDARALGIAMVFQHFSLFETISVAENVWLGLSKSLSLLEVQQKITAKAAQYGLDIDPLRPVHTLSVGERQRVEIVRALLTEPRLLILDEPTSVLTPQAVEKLFDTLRLLSAQGCSILYISHKLHEIRALCTACTVLRGGKVTGVCDPRQESNASLSRLMIGSEPPALVHRPAMAGDEVLAVNGLSLHRADEFGVDLDSISLTVRAGEVLGIAGVSGNGQKELLYALSGEDTRATADSIQMRSNASLPTSADGSEHKDNAMAHETTGQKQSAERMQAVGHYAPQQRRALGLHFVPEERLGRGAVPSMSLAHNLLLTRDQAVAQQRWKGSWIDVKTLRAQAQQIIARFNVKAGGPDAPARSLSGGNLQKFIVGREIEAAPKLLIISQPTWGVDVGASAQIRAAILALRDAGCAVLVVSEELDELFEISDRLQVMAKGRISPPVNIKDATVEQIGEWMSGLWHQHTVEGASSGYADSTVLEA
jgi:general nucleoside transport system ATP-binding protein